MREIKFRGLDIHGEWHIGLLSIIEGDTFISNSSGKPMAFQVREETIGQYTGLKDKNGVEIYEGDLIEGVFIGPSDYVGWCEGIGAFHIFNKDLASKGADHYCYCCGGEFDMYELVQNIDDIEVTGNIYDNPNLLTK